MLKRMIVVLTICALVAAARPDASAQISATVEVCGVVTAYVPATALTPGVVTIDLFPYVIAPGATLEGEAEIQVGVEMCLSATVNASFQITSGSIVVNVEAEIDICATVTAYVAATANVNGYITIGGITYPIVAGATIEGEAQIQIGIEICLHATLNALGQITIGVVSGPGGGNHAPSISAPDSATVAVGQTLAFSVSGSDQDSGDSVTLSASNLPAGASVTPNPASGNPATAQFSFAPAANQAGQTFSVALLARDSHSASASATIQISVTGSGGGGNHSPTISAPASASVGVGQTLSFAVTGSDQDSGDTVTLSGSSLPTGATLSPNPATGNPATAQFTFVPSANQAGQTFAVTFTASDGHGGSAASALQITVTSGSGGSNSAPTIHVPGSQFVQVGNTLQFTITASDPDQGDTVALSATGVPSGSNFDAQTGAFAFTPSASQAGQTFTIVFTATDSHGASVSGTVSITVTASGGGDNNAPILTVPGPQTIAPGQMLTFTVSASDVDGDVVTVSATNSPDNASFNPVTGVFTFTPTPSQAGMTFTVVFTATDAFGASVSSGVLITVTSGGGGGGGGGDDETGSICMSSTHVVFAPQHVGASCGYVIVTLANEGTGTLTITSVTLDAGADFRIDGVTQPMTIAPGVVREIRLMFAPTRKGMRIDTLRMQTTDTHHNTALIKLKGRAIR